MISQPLLALLLAVAAALIPSPVAMATAAEPVCLSAQALAWPRTLGGAPDPLRTYKMSPHSDGTCHFTLLPDSGDPSLKYLVRMDPAGRNPAECRRCVASGCELVTPPSQTEPGCVYRLSNSCQFVSVRASDPSQACP
ncbi:hypothetical protein BOX15_Mlig032375g2 [Macrostomum lignano]|uniref:Secreted protein n=1 Tax=Macrostomum lignano TaxID=282301 RepID=A0A267E0D6_9PLAT|nr:hypothetical protein BOX15_Mlig032375g2 [Macrostomum lignano]